MRRHRESSPMQRATNAGLCIPPCCLPTLLFHLLNFPHPKTSRNACDLKGTASLPTCHEEAHSQHSPHFEAQWSQGEMGRLRGTDTEGCYLPSPHLSCTQLCSVMALLHATAPTSQGQGSKDTWGSAETGGRFQPGVPVSASRSHGGLHYHYFNIDLLLSALLSRKNKLISASQKSSVSFLGLWSNHFSKGN